MPPPPGRLAVAAVLVTALTATPLGPIAAAEVDGAPIRFDEPVLTDVGHSPASIAAGDFDGDGDLDLVAIGSGPELVVVAGDGDGGFSVARSITLPGEARRVITGHLDGDGAPDLVVASYLSMSLLYFRNRGGDPT